MDTKQQQTYGNSYLKEYLAKLKHTIIVRTATKQIATYSGLPLQEIAQTKKKNNKTNNKIGIKE